MGVGHEMKAWMNNPENTSPGGSFIDKCFKAMVHPS